MNKLYDAGIALMAAGIRAASGHSPKLAQMVEGRRRSLDEVRQGLARHGRQGYDVWFHAASLGEFEQARPLMESMLSDNPELCILLTFFSPSGYNVRHDFHPQVQTAYLPFDRPQQVRAFLDAAKPAIAVFVKYEFWGNCLEELKERGVPTYLVSAILRPGQIFFKPWGGMFRHILRCYTRLFVQDEDSRRLLEGIGVTNVTVAGDTRLDRVAAISEKAQPCAEVDAFMAASAASGPTIVFGSSWPADEEYYLPFLHRHADIKAIVAPHEFDAHRLDALKEKLGRDNTILLSEIRSGRPVSASHRYLIVDCFGLLSSLYRYADIAYVGGGFGVGIHNINEAAAFSVPVVFGANTYKFKEAADLTALGGGFRAAKGAEVAVLLESLASDKDLRAKAGAAAGAYIKASKGATDRILAEIYPKSENKQEKP